MNAIINFNTVDEMLLLLSGDYLTGRVNACRTLERLGALAERALPDLRLAVADQSPRLREAAERAIAAIGGECRAADIRTVRVKSCSAVRPIPGDVVAMIDDLSGSFFDETRGGLAV